MARQTVWADRNTTGTRITTVYNRGEQKSFSDTLCRTHQPVEATTTGDRTGFNSRPPRTGIKI